MAPPTWNGQRNVELEALGRKWTLRFDNNDLIDMQRALGYVDKPGSIDKDHEFMTDFFRGRFWKSFLGLRTTMKFALACHHPELTVETVGQIVSDVGFKACVAAISEALAWMMPEREPSKDGETPRPFGGPTP